MNKNAVTVPNDHSHVKGLQKYRGSSVSAEAPNGSIHRFNGVADLSLSSEDGGDPERDQRTLSEKNLLLRGCVLRATEWAVCCVTYTGADTKIALNSKKTPSKLSSVDRIVNRTLAVAIGVMLLVCVISMAFGIQWENANDDAHYLCLHSDDLDDTYPHGGGCENSSTSSVLTIFTFATLYNNFVCISMYVSLEMCYLAQSFFLSNDLKLYDEGKDTPAECHNSGMCADLGQVKYVLSDKTGTLTKNQMLVQQFSVAERAYGEPVPLLEPLVTSGVTSPDSSRATSGDQRNNSSSYSLPSHTFGESGGGGFVLSRGPSYPPPGSSDTSLDAGQPMGGGARSGGAAGVEVSGGAQLNPLTAAAAAGAAARTSNMSTGSGQGACLNTTPLHTIQDLPSKQGDAGVEERECWLRRQFVRNLVYCNTAMLMPDEEGKVTVTDLQSLNKCLQAESPDEVALISSAAEHCGVLLTGRNAHYIECRGLQKYQYSDMQRRRPAAAAGRGSGRRIEERKNDDETGAGSEYAPTNKYSGPSEQVELLAVNEFDSDRKMMSVLVRYTDTDVDCVGAPSSRIMLLCKGADSSMLRNCSADRTPYTALCMAHIDAFANQGLRTLVAGCRTVSEEEAQRWLGEFRDAANSLVNRAELLTECARRIETDMTLLGAIGIEDELQDGVPEAIATLHAANINVWMITGDKAETALAIGKKCSLIDMEQQQVERLVNLADEALRQRVLNLHSYMFLRKQRQEQQKKNGGGRVTQQIGGAGSGDSHQAGPGAGAGSGMAAGPGAGDGGRLSLNRDSEPETDVDHREFDEREVALMVDGISLEGLWASSELKQRFVETVQLIPTVIACRVSPLQKAALVRMIKAAPDNPVTLGIGDGANDVGMIHESRVGVGISGNEGRHAANSADFAIAQFSFLVTLMFDHGRYNYIRCSKLVLYSFFKNLLLVSLLFYFCSYSGWSGTVPLDSIIFAGYNFYLGLPILVVGSTDFDIPREDVLRYPALSYATGRNGEMLNITNMARWCILAFIEGLLLFTLYIRIVGGPTWVYGEDGIFGFDIFGTGMVNVGNGWSLGMFPEGLTMYTTALVAMSYKVASMSVTPNLIFWFVWFLSFFGFFLFVYMYGLFPFANFYNVLPLCMGHPNFWLSILLIPLMLSMVDYAEDLFFSIVAPSSRDVLLERLRQDEKARSMKGRSSSSGVALRNMSEGGPVAAPVATSISSASAGSGPASLAWGSSDKRGTDVTEV